MSEVEQLKKQLADTRAAHLAALNPKGNEPLLRKLVQKLEERLRAAEAAETKLMKEGEQSARKRGNK